MSAETIARALGAAYRSGGWWRCRCPAHNSSGATLALRDEGGLQVRCFARCSSAAVLTELHRRGLIDKAEATPDPDAAARRREADESDRAKRIAAARYLWRETEPANWIIETYLGGRIILCPIPATIRLHRALHHREANCRRPAMIASVEHTEHGFVGVHCTYLAPNGEGKATAIEPVKRFIGPVAGAAVRLGPATDTVAVSEGIESGLSYQEVTGTPTWVALSAGGIRSLILPPEICNVIIACDPDPVGIMAAHAAARRWHGRGPARLYRPPAGQARFQRSGSGEARMTVMPFPAAEPVELSPEFSEDALALEFSARHGHELRYRPSMGHLAPMGRNRLEIREDAAHVRYGPHHRPRFRKRVQ